MGILARLEAFFERLFEAPAGRLGAKLQPVSLEKRIERAMDTSKSFRDDGVIVPNQYDLHLNPTDYAAFESYRGSLEDDLAHRVLGRARHERYTLVARPRVRIVSDQAVPRGDVRVAANVVDDEGARLRDDRPLPTSSDTMVFARPGHEVAAPDSAQRAYLLVKTDGAAPVQFDLGGALISIGRASDNDVIVDDPQAPARRLRLRRPGQPERLVGEWSARQRGGAGAGRQDPHRLDRNRIPGPRRMTGEILRILLLVLQLAFLAILYLILLGFARSLLRDLRSAEQAQLASQAGIGRLAVLESPDDEPPVGRTIALGPINSIGRNVNNTIFVEDDFVSANHAMLTFRGRSWFIEDQGSTNGTYVNGHRIDRPVALSFGDELTIGRVRMRLER
jgi:pSer/pThr/pTyr-binding forkhead associated (FHA) protein